MKVVAIALLLSLVSAPCRANNENAETLGYLLQHEFGGIPLELVGQDSKGEPCQVVLQIQSTRSLDYRAWPSLRVKVGDVQQAQLQPEELDLQRTRRGEFSKVIVKDNWDIGEFFSINKGSVTLKIENRGYRYSVQLTKVLRNGLWVEREQSTCFL